MNLEQGDFHPRTKNEINKFVENIEEVQSGVAQMIRDGDAYELTERDKNGKITSFKIFSKEGELIYFKDMIAEGGSKSKLKDGN